MQSRASRWDALCRWALHVLAPGNHIVAAGLADCHGLERLSFEHIVYVTSAGQTGMEVKSAALLEYGT